MSEQVQLSNKISVGKFIFYSLISFGIYEFIWVYRGWKFFKEKENLNIYPFWRAVFAIFFIYSLFKKIQLLSQENGYQEKFSPGLLTAIWIGFNFVSSLPSPLWLISFFRFLPLIKPLKANNFYWERTQLPERQLKWWQIILIILGSLLFVFTIINEISILII